MRKSPLSEADFPVRELLRTFGTYSRCESPFNPFRKGDWGISFAHHWCNPKYLAETTLPRIYLACGLILEIK